MTREIDQTRIYAAWEVLGTFLDLAANKIADDVGPDVLEYLVNRGEFDSFVKDALAKEATVTTYEA